MQASPRRALIVIDVQNEYVTGNLRIAYPPVDQSLANIGRAMDAAHAAEVPVVVVQQRSPADAPIFAVGSDGYALHDVVASRPYAHLVQKTLASAFPETDLAEWLQARNIDTVTVVGYMTHNCDASTVNHAAHMGLAVELLNDATGSLPYSNAAGSATAEEIHRVYTVVMHSAFAAVVSTDVWVAALQAKQALPRGSVYASNQAALATVRDVVAA